MTRRPLSCDGAALRSAVVAAVFVLAMGIQDGHAQVAQRVLRNLAAGPPADPLPPLRANRPSAAEMAARPRRRPYLFFTADERQALRDRAKDEPFGRLAQRIRASAERCLTRTPAPWPAVDPDTIPSYLPDGSVNPAMMAYEYSPAYNDQYAVREVIPTLGFAYQLTGDRRFGEAGKRWLLEYAGRPKLTPKAREHDFFASNILFGMAVGYDWLWELLNDSERDLVRQRLVKAAAPLVARAKYFLSYQDPDAQHGYLGGNHQLRTHSLFAVVPLALLYEVPEASDWLDLEIQLNRDRLLPSAWAPDGEFYDRWHYFFKCFENPMGFMTALKHMGGEDLFHEPNLEPRFRRIAHFYLYGMEQCYAHPPLHYQENATWAWLALASQLRDSVAQWVITKKETIDAMTDEGTVFAYLSYDPSVEPAAPTPPPGSVYFPYHGMVQMCSDWSEEGVLIPFRCGPEIGKETGDQNGFVLRTGGEWVLQRPEVPKPAPGQSDGFRLPLLAWFGGAASKNIVLPAPDGLGDAATYHKTGEIPLKGGIQYSEYPTSVKGRDYPKQWLSGPDVPKRGDLRVVHLDEALDYVCGEAHRAYAFFTPKLWVRHLLFVKEEEGGMPPYVLVCDEVEAGEKPTTFAWQLHCAAAISMAGRNLVLQGGNTRVDVRLLSPAGGDILLKATPAPMPKDRTPFVQWRTPGAQSRCFYLASLTPTTKGAQPSFRVLEAEGGWAVEATSAGRTDVALFRSERAKSVSAGGVSTTGTAALLRKRPSAIATLYVLGSLETTDDFQQQHDEKANDNRAEEKHEVDDQLVPAHANPSRSARPKTQSTTLRRSPATRR